MQRPTCTGIRIRSTHDADVLFHAVALNILPMVVRRLDSDERMALCSGCVYVWEERWHGPPDTTEPGIERFTDGRAWGPSRARDDFLFYYEKSSNSKISTLANSKAGSSQKMIKQTYSVYVNTSAGLRKWHLNAYYTQETVDDLATVDDIPMLRRLVVPEARYICARASRSRDGASRPQQSATNGFNPIAPAPPGQFFAFSSSPSSRSSDTDPAYRLTPPSESARSSPFSDVGSAHRPPGGPSLRLAPLEYLQGITRRRDPIDDEAIRALSRSSVF